jgi:predicted RNA-binding protein with TRAM domain
MRQKVMEQQVPVKEGQEYEVEVQAVGAKGDGICRVRGFVVFVPGVKKGDYVKIKVKKVLAKAAFGEFVAKLDKKPASSSHSSSRSKNFATVKVSDIPRESYKKEYKTDIEETDDFGADFEDDDEM